MGWTQTYNAGPTKPFLIAEMEQGDHYRVLDYAANLTVAWMAVECLTDFPYGKGRVFATVTLIRRDRDGSITTKDMSESMGVIGDDTVRAPLRILDKLSPVEDLYGPELTKTLCDRHYDDSWDSSTGEHPNQREVPDGSAVYAAQWREGVREYHAKREAAKAVKPGTVVRFAEPLRFTNGDELADFEFVKGNTFRAGYTRYRIGGWRTAQFTVLS